MTVGRSVEEEKSRRQVFGIALARIHIPGMSLKRRLHKSGPVREKKCEGEGYLLCVEVMVGGAE